MKTLKCLLIDDEPLALDLLTDYVERTPFLALQRAFTNPIEALKFIQQNPPELIFLDVQMPELTGVQLMKILNQTYPIVLTTAYEQFALEGFEQDVFDYLLKPISYERFYRAAEKVLKRVHVVPSRSVENQPTDNHKAFIFVKSEYRVLKLMLSDIHFLEGLGDYVAIHTKAGKILTLDKMKYFEQVLPSSQFMRIHKSYIVSFPQIEFIERNRIIIGDKRIPVSDTYKKAFWERIKPNP